MMLEEVGKTSVQQFCENLDRSVERLMAMSNTDLKATFKELFIRQGKPPEHAELMAEIATQKETPSATLKEAFKALYLSQGKTPEVAERMAENGARGR